MCMSLLRLTVFVAATLVVLAHEPVHAEEKVGMSPRDFVKDYEAALASQDWIVVAPLISDEARVVFSDGSLHGGKDAIRTAYERNFAAIKNEDYRIENVHWLIETSDSAAYMFDFYWSGVIQGREASGSGRGTAILARKDDRWVLVAEQLGPFPRHQN